MNRPVGIFLIHFSFLALASCSVQQKISGPAKKLLLNDSALLTAHVGISIYEPATGKYWYDYQGDKYFVPASNTKIPTCYAAMKYLGDSLVGLRYKIISDSSIKIKPTGDPSFLSPDFKTHPVYLFLKKYKFIRFTGEAFGEDHLGPGWTWNDYKEYYAAQRNDFPIYGNCVTFTWVSADSVGVTPAVFAPGSTIMEPLKTGFDIVKPWEENKFIFLNGDRKYQVVPFRPDYLTIQSLLQDTLKSVVSRDFDTDGYTESIEYPFHDVEKIINVPDNAAVPAFAIIRSQPTDSLLKLMMHRSDNFFAEQTLLMASNEMLGVMRDERIIDTLLKSDFKDLPQQPRWVDGSGLSRYNLFTPQSLIAILHKMKNEFPMERIKEIFPTGGEGTLSSYYKADSGYIYAKTGTLSGVVALSGYLYTKKNKLLIFSVLVNNHRASAAAVRKAVEKFIKGIREKY